MKNNFLKISLIIIGIITVISIVFIVVKNNIKQAQNSPSKPVTLTQLDQFPVENDNFRITYNNQNNTLTIVPKIPFDTTDSPEYFLSTYWKDYTNHGKEALSWLNTHNVNQQFRTNYGIEINWWAQEWWPNGVTAPTL
ncbi:MAG: hypothetical protein WCP93_01105 [Candidatus Berkelbacteria bacterium]